MMVSQYEGSVEQDRLATHRLVDGHAGGGQGEDGEEVTAGQHGEALQDLLLFGFEVEHDGGSVCDG